MKLDGYKTYIQAFLIMVNAVLFGFNVYDFEVFMIVMGLLTGGSLMSLRSGVKKVENANHGG